MKKLLFLPLAAMLCFGCSKTEMAGDDPQALALNAQNAKKAVNETINVLFSNKLEEHVLFTDNTTVEYTDVNGQRQVIRMENGNIGYEFTILAGSSITVNYDLVYNGPEQKVYAGLYGVAMYDGYNVELCSYNLDNGTTTYRGAYTIDNIQYNGDQLVFTLPIRIDLIFAFYDFWPELPYI